MKIKRRYSTLSEPLQISYIQNPAVRARRLAIAKEQSRGWHRGFAWGCAAALITIWLYILTTWPAPEKEYIFVEPSKHAVAHP